MTKSKKWRTVGCCQGFRKGLGVGVSVTRKVGNSIGNALYLDCINIEILAVCGFVKCYRWGKLV